MKIIQNYRIIRSKDNSREGKGILLKYGKELGVLLS
jgi:hypothetical protein